MIPEDWKFWVYQPFLMLLTSIAILKRLLDNPTQDNWQQFIDEYAKVIFYPIRKFSSDSDEQMELFTYVCESLLKNDFAKLRKYTAYPEHSSTKFTTWLVLVVRNLCIDWYRNKNGRFRLYKAIKELSDFDKEVFELLYLKNYHVQEAFEIIKNNKKFKSDIKKFSESIERINNCLTRSNRQKLSELLLRRSDKRYIAQIANLNKGLDFLPQKSVLQPDAELELKAIHQTVQKLLVELSPEEKLLLRYWFDSGFPAKKIAALMGLGDEKKVYTKIKMITTKLRKKLEEQNITGSDLEKYNDFEFLV